LFYKAVSIPNYIYTADGRMISVL